MNKKQIEFIIKRRARRDKQLKQVCNLFVRLSKEIIKIFFICIFCFVSLAISISAGIGSKGLIQWLNFNLLSENYLYYASYGIAALTFYLLFTRGDKK